MNGEKKVVLHCVLPLRDSIVFFNELLTFSRHNYFWVVAYIFRPKHFGVSDTVNRYSFAFSDSGWSILKDCSKVPHNARIFFIICNVQCSFKKDCTVENFKKSIYTTPRFNNSSGYGYAKHFIFLPLLIKEIQMNTEFWRKGMEKNHQGPFSLGLLF